MRGKVLGEAGGDGSFVMSKGRGGVVWVFVIRHTIVDTLLYCVVFVRFGVCVGGVWWVCERWLSEGVREAGKWERRDKKSG